MLAVTNVTACRWIKDGRFDIQRVGGEVLIPNWEVEMLRTRVKKDEKQYRIVLYCIVV